MKFIADFHIHSHFSIATSKKLIPENLVKWAQLKGIKLVGTGDFVHPGWMKELKEKIEPAEQGLFRIKNEYRNDKLHVFSSCKDEVRFILTAEISNIYKKQGEVRKVHNLIFVPDFTIAEKIQKALAKIGNITSDGRPILGLDSKNLLEIVLESSDDAFLIPAHIWTPWFSVLGSKSGFDNITECYDELTDYIFAVETGLSSDPPMNWMCSFLDRFTIVSNSDAHSPEKLGREANIFDTELSYNSVKEAMKTGNPKNFLGTIEFFPQEGKYHFDGHRKCGIRWSPIQTLQNDGICPECHKKVTIGVMNRVAQLADRENCYERRNRHPFYSLIPLKEIIAEFLHIGVSAKSVDRTYNSLLEKAGSEFTILLDIPEEELKNIMNKELAQGIIRMRKGNVYIEEGYDGEFGKIKVFNKQLKAHTSQKKMFGSISTENQEAKEKTIIHIGFNLKEYKRLVQKMKTRQSDDISEVKEKKKNFISLNTQQEKAIEHHSGPILIIAGPGTGKTLTLTSRIAHLIRNRHIKPEHILAITFTNKASMEMKERLNHLLEDEHIIADLNVSTFHSFGLSILKEHCNKFGRDSNFSILDEEEKKQAFSKIGITQKEINSYVKKITSAKQLVKSYKDISDENFARIYKKYEQLLKKYNAFDIDDLIYYPVKLLSEFSDIANQYREKYQWILVDEYQDINYAQYQFIRLLAPNKHSNLSVIGDPNQAIYGFRGANVKFIKDFTNDYPNATVYILQKSYRCSDRILKASDQVIGNISKTMLKGMESGIRINIAENATDKSEAEFVARTIESMMGGLRFFSIDSQVADGYKTLGMEGLSDFAVLCRINRQMDAIEKAFIDHSIPYQKITNKPFFQQRPVNTIIDFLKLSMNLKNDIILDKLAKQLSANHKVNIDNLRNFADTLQNMAISKAVKMIVSNYLKDETDNVLIKELLNITHDFGKNAKEFIRYTILGSGIDAYKSDVENVALMSIHSAKGLEFKTVFIVGCENGLLPYTIFNAHGIDLDEERRLFYVGMTRAKKFLFLTYAKKRMLFGQIMNLSKSPYLSDIEKELVKLSKSEYKKPKKKKHDDQETLFSLK
ncbi:MAG: DNA helicase UvrD [Candidatus Cloacimonadota bacterium]|nr:MAG: DNA helicase UvrD [Candidatus Cloacimonadota bacterium]